MRDCMLRVEYTYHICIYIRQKGEGYVCLVVVFFCLLLCFDIRGVRTCSARVCVYVCDLVDL